MPSQPHHFCSTKRFKEGSMKAKTDAEKEAVLTTLEQLSQTMEAMNQVIHRLRQRVEAVSTSQSLEDQLFTFTDDTIVH